MGPKSLMLSQINDMVLSYLIIVRNSMHLHALAKSAPLFGIIFFLSACTTPSNLLRQLAETQGSEEIILTGNGYRLRSYINQDSNTLEDTKIPEGNTQRLHVYLEGDGYNWLTPSLKATDPTSLNPMMLRMMMDDPYSSLYLARPCYNGIQPVELCSTSLWTHKRYSKTVVNSMSAALENFLKDKPHSQVVLIGHSGGGTLALLIAAKLSNSLSVPIVAVITLAGNLDIERWTDHHHYTPLSGSINPITAPPLNSNIAQIHFAGIKDNKIPIAFIENYVTQHPQSTLIKIKHFDHNCCWESEWPDLLRKIDQLIEHHNRNQ